MSSIYIDEKYLNMVSGSLTRFVKKSSKLYNCRCEFCGDGHVSNRKARGYFFHGKDNNIVYSCHNCSIVLPFEAFLQRLFPQYYTQYKLDSMRTTTKLEFKPKIAEVKKVAPSKLHLNIAPRKSILELTELTSNHPARAYIESRGLPDISRFKYAHNFAQYVEEETASNEAYRNVPKDSRVIIPITSPDGVQWGFQGRALDKKSKLRYITIKESEQFCKVYGLDKFDKNQAGFIVEGPFDSEFLPNCISMCGSSLDMSAVHAGYIIPKNTIIIFDNEPRSKEIIHKMELMVDSGFRVYVPPKSLDTSSKDINLMVNDGWTQKQLVQLFVSNSYTGLLAKVKINNWKRA